jgi:poly(3-hydroxybutyrate) depolymerase
VINTSVAGYPHPVAIYAPSNATRAIVVLHGGGGNNTSVANQLAMNTSSTVATLDTVNWTWLDANQVMLVLPQGQHIDTASAPTWSNYAMTSGQDDKGLLQALSANLRATYGFTHITLMGHSMGGTMTNRMWCESPTTFNAYVSLAGPASSQFQQTSTPCACVLGAATPPYMGIIGDSDSVMQTSGNWTNTNWYINPVVAGSAGFLNSTMIGEWYQQGSRVSQVCGGTVDLNAYSNAGNVDTWTSCGGKLVLKRVLGADHGVDKIAAQMNPANPTVVMDAVMAFVKAQ